MIYVRGLERGKIMEELIQNILALFKETGIVPTMLT